MVDRDTIERFIRLLRQYLKHLRQLAEVPADRFLADPHLIGSARYYLTVSIEACLDIANHLIASEGLRSPKDYKDAFRVLYGAGILPDELNTNFNSSRLQRREIIPHVLLHPQRDVTPLQRGVGLGGVVGVDLAVGHRRSASRSRKRTAVLGQPALPLAAQFHLLALPLQPIGDEHLVVGRSRPGVLVVP
ncbi:MAG TPA: DUF86 domain-containing protein [Chloroflexi bacterium]|nr:DUF86 domain-containing protein [Chloroflexota bacterium]